MPDASAEDNSAILAYFTLQISNYSMITLMIVLSLASFKKMSYSTEGLILHSTRGFKMPFVNFI